MKLVKEDALTAVFTTKQVIKNGSPIIAVFYDEDDDWQFFGGEECNEDDAAVVSVQEILDIDNTLVDLPDLKKCQTVSRANKNAYWEISLEDV